MVKFRQNELKPGKLYRCSAIKGNAGVVEVLDNRQGGALLGQYIDTDYGTIRSLDNTGGMMARDGIFTEIAPEEAARLEAEAIKRVQNFFQKYK